MTSGGLAAGRRYCVAILGGMYGCLEEMLGCNLLWNVERMCARVAERNIEEWRSRYGGGDWGEGDRGRDASRGVRDGGWCAGWWRAVCYDGKEVFAGCDFVEAWVE